MNQTTTASREDQDDIDIDLGAVAKILWAGKWLIALVTVLGAVVALIVAFVEPEVFRAEALLQVRQQSGSSGRLGGLAALAAELGGGAGGLSLSTSNEREVAIATLRSRAVIGAFIEDNKLLPKLYPSKWDSQAKAWKNPDADKNPTAWQAYNDFIKDVLRIADDRKTGLVTLAVEWTDPEEAQQWVTELVARTNAHLKERAIKEGEKNLAYLEAQAQQIGQVELVQALYGLVEDQLKQMMVAKGGDEFALKTIDPAVVPKKRISPNRALILLGGLLIGGVLGAAAAFGRVAWTRGFRSEGRA